MVFTCVEVLSTMSRSAATLEIFSLIVVAVSFIISLMSEIPVAFAITIA
jgi:hypothetical protein